MLTVRKIFPILFLALTVLVAADCEKAPKTEAEFIEEKLLTTGMDTRVNGLQDLLLFAAIQDLNECQDNCDVAKELVAATQKEVAAMETLLVERIGGIKPPPPPCPCQTGNCIWERFAVFSYFVDLKKFGQLPNVTIENLNGEVLSSSEKAEVAYSPGGEQFALVNLPTSDFKDEAVNIVIDQGDGKTEVLVHIK
jgi:hypothetical protein